MIESGAQVPAVVIRRYNHDQYNKIDINRYDDND